MKRTYLDANVVIYYIEQNAVYLPAMVSRMFSESGEELLCCVTSDLVRLESRVRPLRDGQLSLLRRFDGFFAANQMHSVPLDRQVFDLATQLRARHRLKTPDALHLAAAIHSGCDEFWTNDGRLSEAAGSHLQIVTFESTPSLTQTLDQQRAALAWGYATASMAHHGKDYKNLAKAAPALIMNSGLMPTLAFYNGKGGAHRQLLDDLIRGISQRLHGKALGTGQGGQLFSGFMLGLQKCDSRDYLLATDEALELLKWLRQFVDAVNVESTKA